jgi:hypothetical protein
MHTCIIGYAIKKSSEISFFFMPFMPTPKPIQHQPVKSSAVASLGHDAPTQTLEVTYHNKSTYRYAGVSPQEHLSILAAPSKGKALNSLIKRRKLSGTRMDK